MCASMVVGAMWRYLHNSHGRDDSLPREAIKFSSSADKLMRILSEMYSKICTMEGHEACSPYKKYIDFQATTRADQRWKNVLRAHHKEHMAAQRKKIGC